MGNFAQKKDTIAAITTAPGDAAIAAIRISGPEAFAIGEKIFSKKLSAAPSHTALYGKILSAEKASLDHVLLLVMRGPKTYTGEDTIEIFCHGGRINTQRVMDRVLEAGAKSAGPGEFTLKAFLNGKIDLAQAEAVQDLIAAKNDLSLKAAEKHLEGALSKKVSSFQNKLTEIAAILEAWVDFPEEGLEFASKESLLKDLAFARKEMETLSKSFHDGKIIKEGLTLALIGAPNVGKSSLMNALLGKERAIVTPTAGTTRDVLEEDLLLGALHFQLLDTAGIRTSDDAIEQEGIKRSKKAFEEADLIFFVLDASEKIPEEAEHLIDTIDPKKTLLIWNKIDIQKPQNPLNFPHTVLLSALKGDGLEDLKKELEKMVFTTSQKEDIVITKLRHKKALDEAISFCEKVEKGLKSELSAEFVAQDIKSSLHALAEIIGTNVTEDILSSIFSKFCVGK